ncbi:unnamed protein product [Trichobilharzia szidati]|nr:unnamed protein product [Trichobilharzia szidati]
MFVSRSVYANHADLIHDIAYDFYGRRMATCSSDQMIKVWDLKDNGEWVCTASWRCHLGSAWRVSWAHPEFGQVIATCSFDRTIAIWEEITSTQSIGSGGENDGYTSQIPPSLTNTMLGGQSGSTHWIRRAYLVDPRTSVTGLQFAPRHLGLQLAAVSTDGMLRIYEALDVMNLSQWRLQFDFGTKMFASCLSWSQSRIDPPLIAVGSGNPNDSGGNDGSDCLQTSHSVSYPTNPNPSSVRGKLVLYEYVEARRHWFLTEDVVGLTDPIYDLSFAPHIGQSYQTLAVGSKDLYIIRIISSSPKSEISWFEEEETGQKLQSNSFAYSPYSIRLASRFDHHKGRVWRVSWNVTGSLLASSGDDGCVRIWQAHFSGFWVPVSVISPDGGNLCDTALTDDRDNCLLKACLGSILPQSISSSSTSSNLRLISNSNTALRHNEHVVDNGVEQTANTYLGKPSIHGCPIPFQKLAPVSNANQPGAWH